jgi:hypothetical protein
MNTVMSAMERICVFILTKIAKYKGIKTLTPRSDELHFEEGFNRILRFGGAFFDAAEEIRGGELAQLKSIVVKIIRNSEFRIPNSEFRIANLLSRSISPPPLALSC